MAPEKTVKRITDARTMRALTHPLRLRLLGVLRTDGAATASTLAGRVGEAVSLVSYHLHQLGEHGFIEEAPELAKDGRERWWKASHSHTSWSAVEFLDSPERRASETMLRREVIRAYFERIQAFMNEESEWSTEWIAASDMSDFFLKLTPEDTAQMRDEVHEVIERWAARKSDAEDAEQVTLIMNLFPRPRAE